MRSRKALARWLGLALVVAASVVPAAAAAQEEDNIALNKPATADSSCGPDESPEKAVDGVIAGVRSNKWCSLGATKWWQVDLASQRGISWVYVHHAEAGGEFAHWNTRDYDLAVSDDTTSWRTVVQARGNTAAVTSHRISASARYVRLNVLDPTQDDDPAARIYEVQVYRDGWEPPPPPTFMTIQQSVPGNIFTRPEPVEATLVIGGAPQPDTVSWTIYDLAGTLVEHDNQVGSGPVVVRPSITRNGYYRLEAAALRQGAVIATAQTTLALLDPFQVPDDSSFGFSTHFGQAWNPGLMPLLAKAGASTIRDEIYWDQIERAQGTYAFPASYEAYMSAARAANVDPFLIFSYTNQFYDNGATPYTDAGRAGFANYGNAILDQYGDQTRWVEVYNEFNAPFGDRGEGPADSKPDYYYPLLKATYEKVKATHPDTKVVGPAISFVDLAWMERLFQLGGLSYLDAVSVHYPGNPPERMAETLSGLKDLIRRYNNGQDKPIWVTENGWSTKVGGDDERTQAGYAVRAQVIALSRGVEKVYWYDFMNDGVDASCHECNFGLVRNDTDPLGKWTPKPSYASYAAMTRALSGARFERSEQLADGLHSHRFAKGHKKTRVLWSTAGPQTVTVWTPLPVTVTDMMGHTETYHPDKGRIVLSVAEDPLYLTASPLTLLTANSRYTLAANSASVAGQPIPLTLTVDNTRLPRTPINAELQVGGASVNVKVAPGKKATIPVNVPDQGANGRRDFVAKLVVDGKAVARLTTHTDVLSNPFSLNAKHVIHDGADTLAVGITNLVQTAQQASRLSWRVGEATGSVDLTEPIPGGATHAVNIPTAGQTAPGRHSYELRLSSAERPDLVYTGTLVLVDPAAIRSVPQRTITVDGVLDDLTGLPGIDLATDGVVKMNDYGGPDDLSGQFWFTWDDTNLYLSASLVDNAHAQPATNDGIWIGDSIQFAAAAGLPGESVRYYEYGIALTSAGPQAFRWNSAGPPVGPVTDVTLRVTRDESAHRTVYELAMPWRNLVPFQSSDRLLSLSLLANDNDGDIRKGWIEWGSGIGAGKDPAQFRPTRLDPAS